MKLTNITLSVSALVLAASAFAAPVKTSEPAYNPTTVVDFVGTITGVHQVPAGSPMEGVHLTVKSKNSTFDVYLAPDNFMRLMRTSFPVGDQIEVLGSIVKVGGVDVALPREVSDRTVELTLRDLSGTPAWESWGVEINPAAR